MIAPSLIPILLLGGLLAWGLGRFHADLPRWVALITLSLCLLGFAALWGQTPPQALDLTGSGPWIEQVSMPWIPRFGISLHFGLDGLSLALGLLTALLGLMAVSASWSEIRTRTGPSRSK